MENETVRKKLEELHLAILELPPTSKVVQERRDAFAVKIRETLDHEDLEGFPAAFRDSLHEESVAFEAEHPRIAQLLNGLSEIMNSMGI